VWVEDVGDPREEMALDARSREFGHEGKVSDCIKCSRYVQREHGLMSEFQSFHPLLGVQKQHVQGIITGSETKLMIWDQAIGEKEGFDANYNDLADNWKQANKGVIKKFRYCTDVG